MNEKQPTVNIGGTIYTPIDVDKMREIIHSAVESAIQGKPKSASSKKFIRGIHGLAKFLNISHSKAQEIKNSGRISYTQNGRVVIFDSEKILTELETQAKKA